MDTIWIIVIGVIVLVLAYAARGLLAGLLTAFIFLMLVNWIAGWRLVQGIIDWVAGWFPSLTPNLDSTGRFVANLCALIIAGAVAHSIYEAAESEE